MKHVVPNHNESAKAEFEGAQRSLTRGLPQGTGTLGDTTMEDDPSIILRM